MPAGGTLLFGGTSEDKGKGGILGPFSQRGQKNKRAVPTSREEWTKFAIS